MASAITGNPQNSVMPVDPYGSSQNSIAPKPGDPNYIDIGNFDPKATAIPIGGSAPNTMPIASPKTIGSGISDPGASPPAGTPAPVAAPTASSYTAKDWNVTPEQTVQGQMQSMIDPNNPFYQAWATAGKQDAAASGFSNGSMQQSGIINSVMKNATPIATADANTYASSAATNTSAANQASAAGALAQNNLAAVGYQGAVSQSNTAANNASQQLISKTHDENAALLQNSKAATDAFNQFQAAVANIDASTTMDQAAKDAAIANQHDIFNGLIAGLKTTTPGIPDISSKLPVGTDDPRNSPNATVQDKQAAWDKQYSDLTQQLNAARDSGDIQNFKPLMDKINALGPRPT